MDTITHGLLGAALGATLAPKNGRCRAALMSMVVAALPDSDLLLRGLLRHRGETHSFFYLALAAPLLAWAAKKWLWRDRAEMSYTRLVLMIFLALLSHVFLDWSNSYGINLFLPFSDKISAGDATPIFDLLFSVPLLLVGILLCFNGENGAGENPSRRWLDKFQRGAARVVVVWSLFYIGAGLYFNHRALQVEPLRGAGIKRAAALTGTNLIWRGAKIDGREGTVVYVDALRQRVLYEEHLVSDDTAKTRAALETEPVKALLARAGGLYLMNERDDKVYFRDLRYGMLLDPQLALFTAQIDFDGAGNPTAVTRGFRGSPFDFARVWQEIKLLYTIIGGAEYRAELSQSE